MRSLQQSTGYDLMAFMTDSADHVTGKAGLTLAVTASKAGAAFAAITPTVTERGDGWYSLALTTVHTDTLGDLAIRATAAGADPTDLVAQVLVTAATLAPDLTAVKAKTDNLPSDPAAQSLLTASIAAIPAAPTAAANATAVRVELATELARLDVATGTRLATAGYTVPDNASVTAIKAKTDNLPSDPADQSILAAAVAGVPAAVRVELATELARVDVATSTRLATAGYTAPDNASVATVLTRVDVATSTRLATAGYTPPSNADVAAIKAKTDSLTFTVAGQVDANVQSLNDAAVTGTGTLGDAWRGVGVPV